MHKILRLGTRRSLLAMAQSRLIARRIEQDNPGVQVQLVGIETQGDRIQDIPLSKVEGKEFFVAELDTALINADVDLTVHSMKDLSLERPPGIALGAISERENPRDVVLFVPDIIDRLSRGRSIRIGTSSPRRIENVIPFLEKALPVHGHSPKLQTKEIRGNVNTRIELLSRPDDDARKVEGVVLAFAGLKRLWADDSGRSELGKLLTGLRWMILPLKECPTGPAQGALAIECRSADDNTRAMLGKLHCANTAAAVATEREILAAWGGGCHQRFGATAVRYSDIGSLLYVRGRKPDESCVDEIRWEPESDCPGIPAPAWDGTVWRDLLFSADPEYKSDYPDWLHNQGATFVAHSRAMPAAWAAELATSPQRIWTSGTGSWFRLAAAGIWVEGCAEELGYAALLPTLNDNLLGLPDRSDWHILSHTLAAKTWSQPGFVATYRLRPTDVPGADHPAVIDLQRARSVFWSSASQHDLLKEWVPEDCQHACRYGKTYYSLLDEGLPNLRAFPSAAEWRRQVCENNALEEK